MAKRTQTEPSRREEEADGRGDSPGALLLVPVWIGLFLGTWAGIDRLLAVAADTLHGFPPLRGGARALAGARGVIAPVLGLLLGSYAIVLFGAIGRWLRGEPSPCQEPDDERAPPRSGIPRALRDESAVSRIERELDRGVRAERSAIRRVGLALNDRLMLRALRQRGYNDDIGCGGIVFLVVAATAALPFAADAVERLVGFEITGPLGAFLWFGLVYAAFAVRGATWTSRGPGRRPSDRR